MKVGIKCFPDRPGDNDTIKHRALYKNYDYIEVQVMPKSSQRGRTDVYTLTDYKRNCLDPWKKYIDAIHLGHFNDGMNFANPKRKEKNEEGVRVGLEAAANVNAKKVVLHPGCLENGNEGECDLRHARNYLEELNRDYPLIEWRLEIVSGVSAARNKWLKEKSKIVDFYNIVGMKPCFDIGHACKSALLMDEDIEKYVFDLFEALEPDYVHVNDFINSPLGMNSHAHLGKGIFPLEKFLNQVKDEDIYLTIETDSLNQEDIDYVRAITG